MKLTNTLKLPDALYQAIANDPYDPGKGDISATQLIGPPQIRYLRKKYDNELEEDVSMRIWSLLGQAVHAILERADDLAFKEQRLYAPWGSWLLSGQFDRLVYDPEGTLQDYKVTSVWAAINGVKPEWEAQLNVLAWLCSENDFHIKKLEIVCIYRDWIKAKAKAGDDYPKFQVGILSVPLWSSEKIEDYIDNRVELHRQVAAGQPVPCTADERWLRGEKWAVMKKGNKRAVRLFDNEPDAAAFQVAQDNKALYIDHRPGHYVRCEDYCDVAPFCQQWQNEQTDTA